MSQELTITELLERMYEESNELQFEIAEKQHRLAELATNISELERLQEIARKYGARDVQVAVGDENILGTYNLRVSKVNQNHGIINIPREFDPLIGEGERISVRLPDARLSVRMSRKENRNGTVRIRGGAKLRSFFARYPEDHTIRVDVTTPFKIVLTPE